MSNRPASAVPDPSDERAGHARRLGAFLRWLLPLATFFGVVEVLAWFPTGAIQVGLTGLIILAYSGAVLGAQAALRRDRLETAVRLTAAGILVAAIAIAIVQPELWSPLCGIPFVAVGVALPTARGRDLTRLILGAGAAVGLIAVLGALNLAPSHLPGWFLVTFDAAAVAAVAFLVLLLLFQFSDRLTSALSQSVAANRALVATQAELEDERERLDTTLRSIGDGVVATDRDGRVVFVNPVAERLTGWSPTEAIGQPIGAILDVRADDPRDAEEPGPVLIASDGTTRPVAHATAPILAADGAAHGAVVVFRDVSDERRVARERLQIDRQILESQKLESLATLAGGIAQQFNNLLVVIIGNATIARDELLSGGPDGVVLAAIRDIELASDRAAGLAHQMLAFSGRGQFVLTAVDVGSVVREIVDVLGPTLPASVTIRLDLEPMLPPVEADGTQIRQLLMALLVNAGEAIGERTGTITIATRTATIGDLGGPVTADPVLTSQHGVAAPASDFDGPIGSAPDTRMVVIDVTDTGIGMDEATQRQVFQPFFSTKFVGRGLGLAAALGIVRGHLGRIDIRSTPGGGSTFRVVLPARESPRSGSPVAAGSDRDAGQPVDAAARDGAGRQA
jgi:PAS domain S-box-containing protein